MCLPLTEISWPHTSNVLRRNPSVCGGTRRIYGKVKEDLFLSFVFFFFTSARGYVLFWTGRGEREVYIVRVQGCCNHERRLFAGFGQALRHVTWSASRRTAEGRSRSFKAVKKDGWCFSPIIIILKPSASLPACQVEPTVVCSLSLSLPLSLHTTFMQTTRRNAVPGPTLILT